jgi:hypothetical protein
LKTKDGFVIGILFAIVLQLGVIKIVMIQQAVAIWILLALTVYVTYYNVTHRKARFIPVIDGFIIGFGWLFEIFNLTMTFPSAQLASMFPT